MNNKKKCVTLIFRSTLVSMGQPMANQTTTTTTTTGEHNGNVKRKNDPALEDAGPFLVAHIMWPFLWPGYLRLFGHFLLRAVRRSES